MSGKLDTELKCMNCGGLADGYTHPTDDSARPKPGNATICLHCGQLMVFNADMTGFRALTDQEIHDIAGSPALLKAIKAAANFQEWLKERTTK